MSKGDFVEWLFQERKIGGRMGRWVREKEMENGGRLVTVGEGEGNGEES